MSSTNKLFQLMITIYITLKPLYLFESGGVQICDLLIIVAFFVYIVINKGSLKCPKNASLCLWAAVVFALYAFAVNFFWAFLYDDVRLWKSSLYIFFNIISFLYFYSVMKGMTVKEVHEAILNGCVLSMLVNLTGIVVNGMSVGRKTGFFNNPNQLGLFSIVILSFLPLLHEVKNPMKKGIVIMLSVFSIVMSASKAAIFSAIIFAVIYVIFGVKSRTKKVLVMKVVFIIALVICAFLIIYTDWIDIISPTLGYVRKRLINTFNESDSNLFTGRGYGRIAEMGNNFLWGMGEGAYSRFTIMNNHEVHSTFASIMVSYGVIGMIFFAIYLMALLIKKNRTTLNFVSLSGVFMYSITHNSIRNTMIWLLFALILYHNLRPKIEDFEVGKWCNCKNVENK